MSRRSPRNYDGSDARSRRPSLKITCSGAEERPHDKTLCAHVAWKRDDINPRDPRWTPAGPVLIEGIGRTRFGQINQAGTVLARCSFCGDWRLLAREDVERLIHGLARPGVSCLALREVAGRLLSQ